MLLRPNALAALAAFCICSTAQAVGSAPTDWLHFPMYERDTAHAVDLSALKVRPDGLLESGTRYPRSSGEPWTPEDSARGWYYYETRLIDCETGLWIGTGAKLLAHDGTVIAQHDDAAQSLTEWKQGIDAEFARQKWPEASEIFLACAAAFDPALRAGRAKLAQRKPAFLSDAPLLKSLLPDTERMRAKTKPPFDEAAMRKRPPATIKGVLELMRKQRQAWIAGFVPPGAWTVETTAAQPRWSDASKAWLESQEIDVEDVRSRGDGLLDVVLTTRSTQMLGDAYEHRPRKAADANNALLTMTVDCRTGWTAEDKIVWRDFENRALATQIVTTKDASQTLDLLFSGLRDEQPDLLASTTFDPPVTKICAAAAAQCKGADPVLPSEERALSAEDTAAIERATTAAEALAIVRARARALRDQLIPTCRIGG